MSAKASEWFAGSHRNRSSWLARQFRFQIISDFKLQISDFRSQISDFRSQISDFRSQISDLRSQISDLRSQIVLDFRFQTSDNFELPAPDFRFPTSELDFRCRTQDLRLRPCFIILKLRFEIYI